ncbi:anaerobic ribonucleoside-triphosphate reductase activating protein [Lacrimispora sp.]|uniref:anaerobic ribonucleoside-triphosphate reductase activating protein n=1 Tax=Lacrimispora sp. TaxID=2719234 RepID=UPI0028B0C21D|nr:anaerobic ribonucleoside-triphosphate reductase activating protein [Lacrimispora sp.]
MRYASVRSMDISNGDGIGISLFVQGCRFHCKNCFNESTWAFNGGKEWTKDKEDEFLKLADKQYIKRISILGGEPLADENLSGVLSLVNKIRRLYGNTKSIWLYTGYYWEWIMDNQFEELGNGYSRWTDQALIVSQCDILVDGRFIDEQKDLSLRWKGSKNQRVIDVRKSFESRRVVLHCE